MSVFFSIIIPVYNSEKYLNDCLRSIADQSFRDYEVVLIDDGSTDGSYDICRHFAEKDSRIRVFRQKNSGQTVARQTAASYATGQYIACIDSDDWVDKDYLLHFKNALDERNADIVCGGMTRVDGSDTFNYPIPQRKGFYSKGQIVDEIFPILIHPASGEGFSVCVCGKIIRTKLYQEYQNKVDASLRMGEDLTCFLPCLYHAESMWIVDECSYYYRDNPTSFTKRKNVYDWNGPSKMMQGLKKGIDIEEYDFRDQLYRRILRELLLVVVSQFNRNEKYGVIKKDILEHISQEPYRTVVKNARFRVKADRSSIRYVFYSWILKYKWILLAKMYNRYLYR